MTLRTTPPWKVGLLQAVIVVCYIVVFALSIQTIHGFLGDQPFDNPFLGMPVFLTTFVFSALVCGGAVLGYPLVLLFEKNARRAVTVVCWSAAWLAIALGTVLAIALGTSVSGLPLA